MTRLWMLPEGVEEALPEVAWRIETLRRQLLDHYRAGGYQLILPPLLEHLDALLTGAAAELEAQTFKLTDPAGGRLLGLRADMTPQASRIAARHFAGEAVVRLCYLGTVLRTRPDSLGGSRAPRQVGCELFGEAGLLGDLEILRLMLETLQLAQVREVHLDLGHVGIYRAICSRLALEGDDETAVFDILQRKSQPDLRDFAASRRLPAAAVADVAMLMDLNGDAGVVERARRTLNIKGLPGVAEALTALERAIDELRRIAPQVPLHVDLAELRGYRYHTGLVFAAFAPGHGRELARGGRYDGAGAEFGEARPATGFSADVNELLRLGSENASK